MEYTSLYNQLTRDYSLNNEVTELSAQNLQIKNYLFRPNPHNEVSTGENLLKETFEGYNSLAYRNQNFRFPIISNLNGNASKGAIILLHGLNERSWQKYLPWGVNLAKRTGKAVILFPIAYHINRSPEAWGDPRQMQMYLKIRKENNPGIKNLSVANVALSERLSKEPGHFFLSGYQSANELIQLSDDIYSGKYAEIEAHSTVDFFAYSIGAFLAEILLIANPDNRFSNSKFVFFCGGSAFEMLNGNSRLIIDETAFSKLRNYYMRELKHELKRPGQLPELMRESNLGQAFMVLLRVKKMKRLPSQIRKIISKNVYAIGLKKDMVVAVEGIKKSLPDTGMRVLDFDFEYSHENPFPVYSDNKHRLVDKAFDEVMQLAASELS